jgi:hypothetical protein
MSANSLRFQVLSDLGSYPFFRYIVYLRIEPKVANPQPGTVSKTPVQRSGLLAITLAKFAAQPRGGD